MKNCSIFNLNILQKTWHVVEVKLTNLCLCTNRYNSNVTIKVYTWFVSKYFNSYVVIYSDSHRPTEYKSSYACIRARPITFGKIILLHNGAVSFTGKRWVICLHFICVLIMHFVMDSSPYSTNNYTFYTF